MLSLRLPPMGLLRSEVTDVLAALTTAVRDRLEAFDDAASEVWEPFLDDDPEIASHGPAALGLP
jgi:hypothetical protein